MVLFGQKTYALSCFSCTGLLDELTNSTCSIIHQNDSCFITVGYAVDTGRWIVSMDSFKEPNTSAQFPFDYIKPSSGKELAEFYFIFQENIGTNQAWTMRYFCYSDYCNTLDVISSLLSARLVADPLKKQTPVASCFVCTGNDYDSVKNCTLKSKCNSCFLTANKLWDKKLFTFTTWSSSCYQVLSEFDGAIYIQYELGNDVQKGEFNAYLFDTCTYEECSTYDYMYTILNTLKFYYEY
jgi:hypothetical protein